MTELKSPEDHGHWAGDHYIFNPPITIPTAKGPYVMGEIDLSNIQADPEAKRNVISALLNQVESGLDWTVGQA